MSVRTPGKEGESISWGDIEGQWTKRWMALESPKMWISRQALPPRSHHMPQHQKLKLSQQDSLSGTAPPRRPPCPRRQSWLPGPSPPEDPESFAARIMSLGPVPQTAALGPARPGTQSPRAPATEFYGGSSDAPAGLRRSLMGLIPFMWVCA